MRSKHGVWKTMTTYATSVAFVCYPNPEHESDASDVPMAMSLTRSVCEKECQEKIAGHMLKFGPIASLHATTIHCSQF